MAGFRSHAIKIVTIFDEAVSALSSENYASELERIWTRIGESHNRRKIPRKAFEVCSCHMCVSFHIDCVIRLHAVRYIAFCL